MFSKVFLAQTQWEMEHFPQRNTAFMACHFSPYSKGLSNLPQNLPVESIVLLDDSMPAQNHDPALVTEQLTEIIQRFQVKALLLDFQDDNNQACEAMIDTILRSIPCPVAVTETYAKHKDCPVLLSPCPVHVPLQNHLAPWLKQGIFLEIGLEREEITVTEENSRFSPLPYTPQDTLPLTDENLHCHYQVSVTSKQAVFTLQRNWEDLKVLTEEALRLGVQEVIGLYQEFFPQQ